MKLTNQEIFNIKRLIFALDSQIKVGSDDILYDIENGYYASNTYDLTHDRPIYDNDVSYTDDTGTLSGKYNYCNENTCTAARNLLDGSFTQYFNKYPSILRSLGLMSQSYDDSSDPYRFIDFAEMPFVLVVPYQSGDTLSNLDEGCQLSHKELRDVLTNELLKCK